MNISKFQSLSFYWSTLIDFNLLLSDLHQASGRPSPVEDEIDVGWPVLIPPSEDDLYRIPRLRVKFAPRKPSEMKRLQKGHEMSLATRAREAAAVVRSSVVRSSSVVPPQSRSGNSSRSSVAPNFKFSYDKPDLSSPARSNESDNREVNELPLLFSTVLSLDYASWHKHSDSSRVIYNSDYPQPKKIFGQQSSSRRSPDRSSPSKSRDDGWGYRSTDSLRRSRPEVRSSATASHRSDSRSHRSREIRISRRDSSVSADRPRNDTNSSRPSKGHSGHSATTKSVATAHGEYFHQFLYCIS